MMHTDHLSTSSGSGKPKNMDPAESPLAAYQSGHPVEDKDEPLWSFMGIGICIGIIGSTIGQSQAKMSLMSVCSGFQADGLVLGTEEKTGPCRS